jgi:hypothetical protein
MFLATFLLLPVSAFWLRLWKVVDVGRKEATWLVSKTHWNRNSDSSLIMVTDGFGNL